MLDEKCYHRKNCKCFERDEWWEQWLRESREEEGMTLERMGEIMGTTRMAQCLNVKRATEKFRKIFASKYGIDDFEF